MSNCEENIISYHCAVSRPGLTVCFCKYKTILTLDLISTSLQQKTWWQKTFLPSLDLLKSARNSLILLWIWYSIHANVFINKFKKTCVCVSVIKKLLLKVSWKNGLMKFSYIYPDLSTLCVIAKYIVRGMSQNISNERYYQAQRQIASASALWFA